MSWLNPNAAGKEGVGMFLAKKYARLVTSHGARYENIVVWINIWGIKLGIGVRFNYISNIPVD